MKYLLLICLSLSAMIAKSQFAVSGALKAYYIQTPAYYYKSSLAALNDNETVDYYIVHNHLSPLASGLSLRSFGKKYFVNDKLTVGYSLAIGLQHFTSNSELLYSHSSTTYQDSIVNAYNGYEYRTNYSMVFFNHFLDLHIPIEEDLKFIISCGVGISALMRAKSANVPNSSIIDNDYPVALNFIFEPQVVEKYKRFDMGYFLTFHLHSLPLYNWKDDDAYYADGRFKLSDLKFTGIGLRFFLHPKEQPVFHPIME